MVVAVLLMLGGLAWADTEIDRRATIRSLAGQVRSWIAIGVDRARWDQERIDAEFALLERALVHEPTADRRHPL